MCIRAVATHATIPINPYYQYCTYPPHPSSANEPTTPRPPATAELGAGTGARCVPDATNPAKTLPTPVPATPLICQRASASRSRGPTALVEARTCRHAPWVRAFSPVSPADRTQIWPLPRGQPDRQEVTKRRIDTFLGCFIHNETTE